MFSNTHVTRPATTTIPRYVGKRTPLANGFMLVGTPNGLVLANPNGQPVRAVRTCSDLHHLVRLPALQPR